MSIQYDDYLRKHVAGVGRAYRWLCDNCPGVISLGDYVDLSHHDESKWTAEEYNAYDAFFYGGNRSHMVVENFNRAWLHHIHHNKHHWQHWVLMEDDPSTGESYTCLEMPERYVIEMICDWWSFSFAKGDLREIFSWYDKHKSTIKLHKNTMKLVEFILDKIRAKLDEMEAV